MSENPKGDGRIPDAVHLANGERFETIVRLATLDKAFRKRFLTNPKEVLDEVGIVSPPGVEIITVEVPDNTIAISVPPFVGRD